MPTTDTFNSTQRESRKCKWYVMRDLSRYNEKLSAYNILREYDDMEVYTPFVRKMRQRGSKKSIVECPIMRDLLFVRASREKIEEYLKIIPKLQFRFMRGGKQNEYMVVDDNSMDNFMAAATKALNLKYYTPEEAHALPTGSRIRVIGGPLNDVVGMLVKVKGARTKRVLVSIDNFISAVVEVESDYVCIV